MEKSRINPRSPREALEPELVPAPRRSRSARNPFVVAGNALFTLLILAALVGGAIFVVGKQWIDAPGPLQEDRIVNIPPRLGTNDIADLLRREGVIDDKWYAFMGGVLVLKAQGNLKSGEYLFQKQANLRSVIETMVEGKVVQHSLTIPEGLTSEQVVARLLESDILAGTIKEIPREGTLLPETYRVTRGTPRDQVIQRMQQAQRRVLQEVWERKASDLPVKTPEQLVTLASIVERETGKPEERTRVAAVFANRLKQRMRLQSDPTIIYGIVGGKGTLGRPLSRADIDQPTPYNTYVIDGLPPGPIGNPGRASLEATAVPARTRELFFVADGTGGHTFSENYEQHQRGVTRLRQLESQRDSAAESAPAAPSTPAAASAAQPAAAPAVRQRTGQGTPATRTRQQ